MKFIVSVLLLSIITYLGQQVLIPSLGLASLFIVIGISFYFFLNTFTSGNDKITRAIRVFILLYLLHFIYSYFERTYYDPALFTVIKTIAFSVMSFFPFYYVGRKGININHILLLFAALFYVRSILNFILFNSYIGNEYNTETVVNNYSYSFVMLLPIVILCRVKIKYSVLAILLIVIPVMLSSKRGALLCLVGGLIIYLVYQYNSSKNKSLNFTRIACLFIVFVAAIGYYLIENPFFLERLVTAGENQSGRDLIRESIYRYWKANQSVISNIFGFGYNAVLQSIGKYSHNDWIEISFNYGLLGLLIYGSLVFNVFSFYKKKYLPNNIRYSVLSVAVIWFLMSLTTDVFNGPDNIIFFIVLGYCVGLDQCIKSKRIKPLKYQL